MHMLFITTSRRIHHKTRQEAVDQSPDAGVALGSSKCFNAITASRASIPRPCSRFGRGTRATRVVPGQGTRGATRGVGMGYAEYPRPTPPGYSDYTEWGTCCTRAMNGHLHGSCTTCTLPCTQFRYVTYLAAGLRPCTRAMHASVLCYLGLEHLFQLLRAKNIIWIYFRTPS